MWGNVGQGPPDPSWTLHFEDMENKEIAEIRPEMAAISEGPP